MIENQIKEKLIVILAKHEEGVRQMMAKAREHQIENLDLFLSLVREANQHIIK
ncbi:hypothetical protein [Lactococcus allomyrinae]|uniref:hypothetical protein n=1 Tax=Lactococcus allomyrinae TaxID=2419773 RepID=UPI0013C45389|nr:hypothetical protein [Lactococcus allomyrinae]